MTLVKAMQLLVLGALFVALSAFDNSKDHTAVIARLEGKAYILSLKTPSKERVSIQVKFRGKNYFQTPAKLGDRLPPDDIIKTEAAAKVRLIYPNGDHISIAPATAFRIGIKQEKSKSIVDAIFGKFRAVIKSNGPRAGMQVQTSSSVMGVRGTDFHVATWSEAGGSELTVLRGAVSMQPINTPESAVVEVKAGQTATVTLPKDQPASGTAMAPPQLKVQAASKSQLTEVIQSTKVAKASVNAPANTGVTELLKELETKAVNNTLEDIKATDPAAFAIIEKNKEQFSDSDALQDKAASPLLEKAGASTDKSPHPENKPAKVNKPAKAKPTKDDLENDEDAYDKYKWKK